jgi:predicted nucleotidyltransferase
MSRRRPRSSPGASPRPYIDHYRAENDAELREIRERAASAIAEGRRIAQRIRRADPEVRDVILFGSLVEDGPRRKDFDIDLAISGGDVFKAMEAAEDSPFEIDIVCLERLPAHIRDRVRKSGVALR